MRYYVNIETAFNNKINKIYLLENNNKILRTSFMNKHDNEIPYAKHIKIISKKHVKFYDI